jgi:hypothetical protein
MLAEQPTVAGDAWGLVHTAAAAYNAWLRSVASAVGSMHLMRAGVDPLGDLNMARGGAAAFRSQVHLQLLNGTTWLYAACVSGPLDDLLGAKRAAAASV